MANRHLPHDLAQMQSIPLEGKIIMTQERIRQWYEHWEGQVYVSFSGGKDSTVLKHIVDGMYDDVPALFVNTGLEYPEIQKFAMSQKNVVTVRPEMRFDEVLKTYGYPVPSKEQAAFVHEYRTTNSEKLRDIRLNGNKWGRGKISQRWLPLIDAPFRVSDMCCDIMKKKPAKQYEKETGRYPIIGTMACESAQRKSNWAMYGCNAFNKKRPTSQPLSFWTDQDILHYIKRFNVPYCPVYGDIVVDTPEIEDAAEGQINAIDYMGCYETGDKLKTTKCDRTGCTFCMFGCHLEKAPNRFQMLKETHPRQYEYCIGGGEMVDGKWQPNKKGLGLGKVLDYIGVDYE